MEIDEGGSKCFKDWKGGGCGVDFGVGMGGSKVSQILEITAIIASLDTYAGSIKSVRMVNLGRRLNGDGWVGGRGRGQECQKCPKYWELPVL